MIHKRIGVEPKLYLSAVKTLKDILSKMLKAEISDEQDLSAVLDVLDKLLYFDTTLVFDAYIDSLVKEVKTEKNKAEKYATELENKVAERTHELEILSQTDPLTNIYNQRAMRELFRRELISAKRRSTVITLCYLDIDKFKEINDKQGHVKGDEVLKHIGFVSRIQLGKLIFPVVMVVTSSVLFLLIVISETLKVFVKRS